MRRQGQAIDGKRKKPTMKQNTKKKKSGGLKDRDQPSIVSHHGGALSSNSSKKRNSHNLFLCVKRNCLWITKSRSMVGEMCSILNDQEEKEMRKWGTKKKKRLQEDERVPAQSKRQNWKERGKKRKV